MAPSPFVDDLLHQLRSRGFSRDALAVFGAELWRSSRESSAGRPALRRELSMIRWSGAAGSLVVGALAAAAGLPVLAAFVPALLWWLVLCAWVGVELGLVRHPVTGVPSPRIGPANVMTIFRGWAAAPVLALGLGTSRPTPLWVVLCLVAGLTDLVDGTVAVRLNHESRLGRLLDPVLDSFFFSAAGISLASWGLLPWWFAVVVPLRYFLPVVGGIALMFIRGHSLPVRHTPWGQRSTLAIGIAMLVTWGSSLVQIPAIVLIVLYSAAVVAMLLALVGILRRAGDESPAGAL